MTIITKAM